MYELCDKCFSLSCEYSPENNSVFTLINQLGNRIKLVNVDSAHLHRAGVAR